MMLRRMSPDVALLRHASLSWEGPFTGVDRKSPWSDQSTRMMGWTTPASGIECAKG